METLVNKLGLTNKMNLTKERAKEIIKQVYIDLELYFGEKYPIEATFFEKDNDNDFNHWLGGFDYKDPESVGDTINYGEYTEYVIVIDDQKEEAVQCGYYTGNWVIKLNKNNKYERVKQLGR